MSENIDSVRILVVDDSPDTVEVLERTLTSQGYHVFTARAVGEATRILEMTPIDVVITDYKMPQVDGLDLVLYVNTNFKHTGIIMITGFPSIGGAVQAVKHGASEYIEKPFTEEELLTSVDRVLQRLSERKAVHAPIDTHTQKAFGIVGQSEAVRNVYRLIERAASTMANVLITGESGTGKELIARAIHYQSARASSPFVPVNCGGIPEGLLESELFGHLKGSFTGAVNTRTGLFQAADGGTIFLDEISETSAGMQVKLLRVLQDKEVTMVGDTHRRRIDVRIVAATNKNLMTLVKKGRFRDDLFFRLSVITITAPPLRERGNDILLLVRHFAARYAEEADRQAIDFSESAIRIMKSYSWPGNVRELENVVQRLMVMTDASVVEAADLPSLMRNHVPQKGQLHRTLADVEAEHIKNVLASVGGNKTQAAKILGIDRKTLRQKISESK